MSSSRSSARIVASRYHERAVSSWPLSRSAAAMFIAIFGFHSSDDVRMLVHRIQDLHRLVVQMGIDQLRREGEHRAQLVGCRRRRHLGGSYWRPCLADLLEYTLDEGPLGVVERSPKSFDRPRLGVLEVAGLVVGTRHQRRRHRLFRIADLRILVGDERLTECFVGVAAGQCIVCRLQQLCRSSGAMRHHGIAGTALGTDPGPGQPLLGDPLLRLGRRRVVPDLFEQGDRVGLPAVLVEDLTHREQAPDPEVRRCVGVQRDPVQILEGLVQAPLVEHVDRLVVGELEVGELAVGIDLDAHRPMMRRNPIEREGRSGSRSALVPADRSRRVRIPSRHGHGTQWKLRDLLRVVRGSE